MLSEKNRKKTVEQCLDTMDDARKIPLVMERLLDCLRWERTRNEIANSRQAAEQTIRLISRCITAGKSPCALCSSQNSTRVK